MCWWACESFHCCISAALEGDFSDDGDNDLGQFWNILVMDSSEPLLCSVEVLVVLVVLVVVKLASLLGNISPTTDWNIVEMAIDELLLGLVWCVGGVTVEWCAGRITAAWCVGVVTAAEVVIGLSLTVVCFSFCSSTTFAFWSLFACEELRCFDTIWLIDTVVCTGSG